MNLNYSFIVPVYNRPEEIKELLQSMRELDYNLDFEIVIIEDGSTRESEEIVAAFTAHLNISYYKKLNSGPGASRNYGMQRAQGNYFIILDSDVLLPQNYLREVDRALQQNDVACFGGLDAAHESFSPLQKGINYAMTSFFTTGGVRGNKRTTKNFQPRSFNMGLSKAAFLKSGGFGRIHPGEDPDLALRLKKVGIATAFFPKVFVYHKRRISWKSFYGQVYKFGMTRPILNKWHPSSAKITFWFPSFFVLGLFLSVVLILFGWSFLFMVYVAYFLVIFIDAAIKNKNLIIGWYAIFASLVQFLGYGFGFCRSTYYIRLLNKEPEKAFPNLFFKKHTTK